MSLTSDLIVWALTLLFEALVVYLLVIQGLLRRFLFLGLYFLLSLVIGIGWCASYYLPSAYLHYSDFYFVAEALLAAYLFLSICELTARAVGKKLWWRRVVLWNVGALLSATCFRFLDPFLIQRFVVELLRTILFGIGLVLLVLWAWKRRNYAEDPVAARCVGVMGVYFSLFFLLYGARELAGNVYHVYQSSLLFKMSSLAGVWLPLGCGFALAPYKRL